MVIILYDGNGLSDLVTFFMLIWYYEILSDISDMDIS